MIRRYGRTVLLVVLACTAVTSIARVMTLERYGMDLQAYWFPGHFLWQHRDPYRAYLERQEPALPIHYWDGVVVTEGGVTRATDALEAPAYTAPGMLLLSPLSRLSWPTAIALWRAVSLSLVLVIPWALVRTLRRDGVSPDGLLLLLTLCSMIATREALQYGQPCVLILACMCVALMLAERRPVIAGIFLGVAMSKYSLALPAFLLFAYKRRYAAVLSCVAVQVAATLAVAAIGGSSVADVLASNLRLVLLHLDESGYELTKNLLLGWQPWSYVLVGVGSLAVAAALWSWSRTPLNSQRVGAPVSDFLLVTVLMLYDLLVVYHRRYDHMADIMFIAAVVITARTLPLSERQWQLLCAVTVLVGAVWIVPLYMAIGTFWYIRVYNLSCVTALITAVWLLLQTRRPAGDPGLEPVPS